MKRGYILVYMLVVMSILFALVLRLTSRTEESMSTNISYSKSLEEKYAYESAGHLALDHFKSKGWLQPYNEDLGKKDTYQIPSEVLKGQEARLTYNKGTITIQVGDEYSPYMSVIRLESGVKDSFENDDEILKLLEEPVSEAYREEFIKIEDKLIKNKGKDIEVYALNKKAASENQDKSDLREFSHEEMINFEEDHNEKDQDFAKNIIEENSKQELADEDGLETKTNEENTIEVEEVGGFKTHEEANSSNQEDLLIEIVNNQDEEFNEILERVLSFKDYAYYSDKMAYQADDLMFTRGIMEVSDRTKISGRVYHQGIAIIKSQPTIENGDLRVDGRLIDFSHDTSDFIRELPSIKNLAGVLKLFKDQDKTDYELVEFSIR